MESGAVKPAPSSYSLTKITVEGESVTVNTTLPTFMDYHLIRSPKGSDGKPVRVSIKEVAAEAASADVVFFGESHGHVANHRAQVDLFAALQRVNKDMALSMEHFERDVQCY